MTRPRLPNEILAASELFSGASEPLLHRIVETARVRRLSAGTQVFSQGDANARAHVVLDGAVRVMQSDNDGEEVVMRFIGPGETFGTVALFTGGRYPADAETVLDTIDASWSEAELRNFVEAVPALALNLIRVIGHRLQEVQTRLRELATQSAERRIACTLLRLAAQAGIKSENGTAIAFPLRRKDIADIAGTTLHTASRILSGWERLGLLASADRRLTLRRINALRRIADGTG